MSTSTVNTDSHKIFLQYATEEEIAKLSELHPQKTQIKGFKLAMTLFKDKRANDNKYHRITHKALGLLADNSDATAIIETLKERARNALAQEAEAEATTNSVEVTVSVPMTKTVKFADGSTVEAVRKVISFEELKEYKAHSLNRRNQNALTSASVADILPSAKLVGIREEIYTYTDGENKIIAEGSRRSLAAKILQIDVPSWEFGEPLTDSQVEELSRESDKAKRKHSIHEEALAMEAAIIKNGFTSLSQLIKFYNVVPTKANEKAFQRILGISSITEHVFNLFMDRESISLRKFNDLEAMQRSILSEEDKKAVSTHRRNLRTVDVRELLEERLTTWAKQHEDDFDALYSSNNIARRFADCLSSIPGKNDKLVSVKIITDEIKKHTGKATDYDPKGRQATIRNHIADLALTYLEINEFTEPEQTIDASILRNCIEPILTLHDQDIQQVVEAYNTDAFNLIKKLMPSTKATGKRSAKPQAKATPELVTLLEKDDTVVTFSEVVENDDESVSLNFNLVKVPEAKRREFMELAKKFFASEHVPELQA